MDTLALILSIIGSLNWGLVGIFQFDLGAWRIKRRACCETQQALFLSFHCDQMYIPRAHQHR